MNGNKGVFCKNAGVLPAIIKECSVILCTRDAYYPKMTRNFAIATLKFIISILKFTITTLNFAKMTLNFRVVTLKFTITTLNFIIATLKFTIATLNFIIATLNFIIASLNFIIATLKFTIIILKFRVTDPEIDCREPSYRIATLILTLATLNFTLTTLNFRQKPGFQGRDPEKYPPYPEILGTEDKKLAREGKNLPRKRVLFLYYTFYYALHGHKWVLGSPASRRLHKTTERYFVMAGETPVFLQKKHLLPFKV
ncbi:MAG: hypothetical protein LBU34_08525 [Planctomycetaceae bacterium]|nr:hypothetical protein [Planctomycetaceae bacterium]